MWDLIALIPDHCLSVYSTTTFAWLKKMFVFFTRYEVFHDAAYLSLPIIQKATRCIMLFQSTLLFFLREVVFWRKGTTNVAMSFVIF